MPRLRRTVAALLGALAVLAPAAAAHTSVGVPQLRWLSPSPQPGATVSVTVGQTLSVAFAVADPLPTAVAHVSASGLPSGASLTVVDGYTATATLTWTPTTQQAGSYFVTFNAADNLPIPVKSGPLSFFISVKPVVGSTSTLSSGNLTSWAYVNHTTVARTAPSTRAHAIVKVTAWTPENFPNLVDVLQQQYTKSGWWVQARLSSLPNGRLGWIPRAKLGPYHQVTTHVYVSRGGLALKLTKDGATVFTTRVGVGRPYWPTPHGEFYVRERITGFRDPMYGPIAFGTSARSSVLTDWPGGGFIGIHGTNEPQIIPGRVSHGCIRLRNSQILRLARMLPLGTPVTIS
jgi:hypothetical protein